MGTRDVCNYLSLIHETRLEHAPFVLLILFLQEQIKGIIIIRNKSRERCVTLVAFL